MANKHLIPQKSTLFRNKLAKILENIQRSRAAESLQTREAYVLEAVRLLATFYRTVAESNFIPNQVRTGTSPELELYNENLQMVKDDLEVLFLELENVEGVILENFNLFAAHSNRLNARVKRLGSRVTDFALFSRLPIKNSIFFSDTFSDLSKIDPGSALLNGSECAVAQVEGIVTLPVNTGSTETLTITETPVINSNSNGREGNNEELGSALNASVTSLFDDNADTWFEYERVIRTDDQIPLVLDFTVNLTDSQVINHVRINPNNFGARTEVEILDISTSNDGQLYVSIKDDIPIAGFLVEDEANVFKLAPSTSKFAGQGLFTFTPRFAKYVRIILRQTTPYFINTVQGQQYRYAIGLRDVEIQRIAYEASGEIVSAVFQTTDEVKKVALQANQTPVVASELAEVKHQVSFDDGNSWHDISPLEDDGFVGVETTTAEVLNVNTEDADSVSTDNAVYSLRYKALLSRNDGGFTSGSTSFAEQIIKGTELKAVPASEPWYFELNNNPLVGSVSVIDPSYGSKGKPDVTYLLGKGQGAGTNLKFTLPFTHEQLTDKEKSLSGGVWKVTDVPSWSVLVGGEQWTAGELASAQPDGKVYEYSHDSEGKVVIRFGDGTNGKSPELETNIEIVFTPERLFPVKKNDHTAEIELPTSIDKTRVQISRRGPIVTNVVEARRDAQVHRLEHRNIVIDSDHPIVFSSGQSVLDAAKQQTFRNGQIDTQGGELSESGQWSIDLDRGIIYSYDRAPADTPVTITYFYQTEQVLSTTDWEWGDQDPLHHSVKIKDSAWVTNDTTGLMVTSGLDRIIGLTNLSVVEGSVQFNAPADVPEELNPFVEEVPFADGQTELTQVVRREEQIPTLVPTGDIATFTASTPITTTAGFVVGFDNISVFATLVGSAGAVNDPGEYYVDTGTNVVTVHTDGATITDPGKVRYWSDDPTSVPAGAYSVDYVNGVVHIQRAVNRHGYTVDYEYADYIARYDIARVVPEEDWVLDSSSKTITIESNEIRRKARSPSLTGDSIFRPTVYQVNYSFIGSVRQDIAELAPYFSPVLKDYALQVITKGFI